MFTKVFRLSASFVLCLLLGVGLAEAQGVGATGELKGTVTGPTGSAIPMATATVTDVGKGLKRFTQTDAGGRYVATGLAPATYDVAVEAAGFRKEIHKSVVLGVGQTIKVDFHLKESSAGEPVEVTAPAPVVEVGKGNKLETMTEPYLDNLPINHRDLLALTLLAPGISNSETLVGVDDRLRQAPRTGFSFYGGVSRGDNLNVDGGEFNGESGAVQVNPGQDAVQEFQIERGNYGADLRSASGDSINIISKSGTKDLHGSVYGFFRDDALDARNPFAFSSALTPGQTFSLTAQAQPVKDSFSRQQYGASLGVPIRKGKTFMFLAYEGLAQSNQESLPLLLDSSMFAPQQRLKDNNDQQEILADLVSLGGTPVPCLTGQPALPATACGAILRGVLTINPAISPLNAFLANLFESDGGPWPVSTGLNAFSARLDHTFNARNQGYLRYFYGKSRTSDPDRTSLVGDSRGSTVRQWSSSLQGSWVHQFNAGTQNEARAQWNLTQLNVLANDPGGPGFDIMGFGAFGRDNTLPDFSTVRRYDLADNLTMVRGRHTMKAGVDEMLRGDRSTSAMFFGGDFNFGPLPGGILSPCLQVPAACGLDTVDTSVTPALISSLQAFSLGLPSYYQQGFGSPTTVTLLPLTALYWQDQFAVTPNFRFNYGVRYELDERYVLPTDYLNFAPRVSFAWDPTEDHKTVIRGGAGLFYSPTYARLDFITKELGDINNTRQVSAVLIPLSFLGPLEVGSTSQTQVVQGKLGTRMVAISAANIFQTLFAQGKLGTGISPNNPCNLTGGIAGAGSGACITLADLTQFGPPFSTFSNSGPVPLGADIFSLPSSFHNPYSEQASFGFERQVSTNMSFSASYIYVHTLRLPRMVNTNSLPNVPLISGVPGTNGLAFQSSGGCLTTCFADPTVSQNNVFESNATAVYHGGILEFQRRLSQHYTLMANYTYSRALDDALDFNSQPFDQTNLRAERSLSSFDQRHKVVVAGILDSPWKNNSLQGFQLSPIFRYNSPHPFNLLAGTDVNGDRVFGSDRPPGAGRNTGIGPNYLSFDLRLARRFRLADKGELQFTAEAFNLFNRLNYSTLNNVVGPAFAPLFDAHGVAGLLPSQPLAFTGAFPRREIKLVARVSF